MILKNNPLFVKNSIRTFSGHYIDLLNPLPGDIHIEDIAHALARMPRFAGHLQHTYSVAQHSLWCYYEAPAGMKLEALLHDASEAYLMDIPSPLKDALPQYREIEYNLTKVIFERFGLQFPLPDLIKQIDLNALRWEWATLVLGESNYHRDAASIELTFRDAFLNHYRND